MKKLLITSFTLALAASSSAFADQQKYAEYSVETVNTKQQSTVAQSVKHQVQQDILFTVKTMQQPMVAEKQRQLFVKAESKKKASE